MRFPFNSGPLPDALRNSLLALKESADAFPLLKSAVAGVLAVWEIAERVKHSQSDACGIALRTQEFLDVVAEAVPDPSVIPAPMLQSIERFTVYVRPFGPDSSLFSTVMNIRVHLRISLLDDIQRRMDAITVTGGVSRVMHLNRNEGVLRETSGLTRRIGNFYGLMHRIFRFAQAASAWRLEVQHAELAVKQTERTTAGANA
ncbi:hypothetical protein B0H11DRAFT_2239848 [Mycena galericulata]|nr:hypothetical protein B0H11DRAFT_2239848 [Mycena galericulata]